jgi:hypothetical protein
LAFGAAFFAFVFTVLSVIRGVDYPTPAKNATPRFA